eukprot:scaffold3370_cov359-Prasinococcus_capsulatus_cf.AAC.10
MGQTDQLPMQRSGSIPWLPSIDSLLSEQEAALCCDLLSCDNLYRPKSFSDLGALYQGDHHGLGTARAGCPPPLPFLRSQVL